MNMTQDCRFSEGGAGAQASVPKEGEFDSRTSSPEWTLQRHWGGEPFWDSYLHPECVRLETSKTNQFKQ